MKIEVKKLRDTAKLPTKGSAKAAGADIYADIDKEILIHPHTREPIGTGLAIAVPEGYAAFLFARSGKATKEGVRPSNCVGVIDSDYRGEVIANLTCDDLDPKYVKPGERIAQLVILPVPETEYEEVDQLDSTERGDGGFGSTGQF